MAVCFFFLLGVLSLRFVVGIVWRLCGARLTVAVHDRMFCCLATCFFSRSCVCSLVLLAPCLPICLGRQPPVAAQSR